VPSSSLPAEVTAFVDAHISSVPQLQSLLLVHEAGPQGATAAALAGELHLSERVVRAWLDHFVRRQVLTSEGGIYVCGPSCGAVGAVADAYARRPVTVSRHIYAANGPARRFADAFLFRDDREEP
jgi:hypothetical protein